ncbi:cystathionine gamma-synthase family protein [Rosenbergiella epipactidis]|uniref:cystathionine gamma-synthase family protein n=1 Tax=Rosenbergiella epipactidis TaxID=1544694 RepID=UPI00202643AB|nr:cystathionine gamma-synthase family protein [Rosenbergiella epipactidis]MCL9667276.1 cystathionine gamma-synthase family protein [Rosenbergiella epipactidis]
MGDHKTLSTAQGEHVLHPQTLMTSYGYDPMLSEGAVKPPIFLSSTFIFRTAEEGKAFFNVTSGRTPAAEGQREGLVYSRFNHPNSEIVEDRLALYEGAERGVLFSSGMSAITTVLMALCQPGETILTSQPLYGGTETLFNKTLSRFGIQPFPLQDTSDLSVLRQDANQATQRGPITAIFAETPANPTNAMTDISLLAQLADELEQQQGTRPYIICDNTLLGPIFQKPLALGADITVYSLTKYVGGHSDLVAGAALGSHTLMTKIKQMRSAIGTQLDPHTSWMLGRSLETLQLRMEKAADNAQHVARYLQQHAKISAVTYPPLFTPGSQLSALYDKQCTGGGSTFSFEVGQDEAEAFRFLNALKIFKLAVSLGGTESLISHPASTTHSGVAKAVREKFSIFDTTIRISIGIEYADDLIADLRQALEAL